MLRICSQVWTTGSKKWSWWCLRSESVWRSWFPKKEHSSILAHDVAKTCLTSPLLRDSYFWENTKWFGASKAKGMCGTFSAANWRKRGGSKKQTPCIFTMYIFFKLPSYLSEQWWALHALLCKKNPAQFAACFSVWDCWPSTFWYARLSARFFARISYIILSVSCRNRSNKESYFTVCADPILFAPCSQKKELLNHLRKSNDLYYSGLVSELIKHEDDFSLLCLLGINTTKQSLFFACSKDKCDFFCNRLPADYLWVTLTFKFIAPRCFW